MSDLKPCPFCGGAASLIPSADHSTACEIGCRDDTCPAYECVWDVNEASAIAAWNRRASPTPEAELEMKKAFVNAASHLMAAASAYRKYAKGDPLFTTRAEDYDRAVVRARSALFSSAEDARREALEEADAAIKAINVWRRIET